MTRGRVLRRVGLVVLATNVALVLAKGIVWWHSGSIAVGSEAVNSLTDAFYSLVLLAGLILTTRPPDFEHPHGHERIEPFIALVVAMSIVGAGIAVVWRALSAVVFGAPPPRIGAAAIGVLLGAAIVKYGLYRYCVHVGNDRNSPALVATGLDSRNDILTALVALVGVLGVRAGVPVLDPIAAALVAVGIFYTGYMVVRDNINYLIGRAPSADLRGEIIRRALSHPEVAGAHDVVAHYVGPEVDVSLHIEVEGDHTLLEAHDIETAVAESIRELDAVDDVFVHVDPKELGEWKEDYEVDRLVFGDGDDDE